MAANTHVEGDDVQLKNSDSEFRLVESDVNTSSARGHHCIYTIDELNERISNLSSSMDRLFNEEQTLLFDNESSHNSLNKLNQSYMDHVLSEDTPENMQKLSTQKSQNVFKKKLRRNLQSKESDRSIGKKPMLVELHTFPGYDHEQLTPLPSPLIATFILNIVINAQADLKKKPTFKKVLKEFFKSTNSQAILQDAFWWYFCSKYQPTLNSQMTLFDRISKNYTNLLVSWTGRKYHDVLFKDYASLMSQAVYSTFCYAFPASYHQFNGVFRDNVLALITMWMLGTKPAPRTPENWNLFHLEPAGMRKGVKTPEHAAKAYEFDFTNEDNSKSERRSSRKSSRKVSALDDRNIERRSSRRISILDDRNIEQRSSRKSSRKSSRRVSTLDDRNIERRSSRRISALDDRNIEQRSSRKSSRKSSRRVSTLDDRSILKNSMSSLCQRTKTNHSISCVSFVSQSNDLHTQKENGTKPTYQLTDNGVEIEQSMEKIKKQISVFGMAETKKRKQSCAAEESPRFTKVVFDLYGRSPLVEHFLECHNLLEDAGRTTNGALEDDSRLSAKTYEEMIHSTKNLLKAAKMEYESALQVHTNERLKCIRKQQLDGKKFARCSGKLLSNSQKVKKISDLLRLPGKEEPEDADIRAAMLRSLVAHALDEKKDH